MGKVAVCVTIGQDELSFLDLVSKQKHFNRSQSLDYVIKEFIKGLRAKAKQQKEDIEQHNLEKRNLEETVFQYQKGKVTQ